MTLRKRLVLSAAYMLLVVVVAFEVPIGINIHQRNVAEFRSALLARTAIAQGLIADALPPIPKNTQKAGGTSGTNEPIGPAVGQVVNRTAAETGARVVAVDWAGRVVADSANQAPIGTLYATPKRPEFGYALENHQVTSFIRYSKTLGQNLMVVTVPVWESGRVVGAVRSSAPLGQVEASVRRAWWGLAGIGAALVFVGLVLAWVFATSLSKPVRSLQQVAARFGAGDLEARAEPSGPGEVAALASSFNDMADEVSATLRAQHDFLANASHQLRTPLTGLRLRLEAIEAAGAPGEDVHKAMNEVDRLSMLVHDLLALEAASLSPPAPSRADLTEAARTSAERWADEARRNGVEIRVEARGEVNARTSPDDVAQILDNLIENSIRYAGSPGTITIRVSDPLNRPTLQVSDSGPGISPEDRNRVFERFYRGSAGRRAGPGTGLGLAIVGQLVRRWEGDVRIADGGKGATIEVAFRPAGLSRGRPQPGQPAAPPEPPYRILTEKQRSAEASMDTVET